LSASIFASVQPHFIYKGRPFLLKSISVSPCNCIQIPKDSFIIERESKSPIIPERVSASLYEQAPILKLPATEESQFAAIYGKTSGKLVKFRVSYLPPVVLAFERYKSARQTANVRDGKEESRMCGVLHDDVYSLAPIVYLPFLFGVIQFRKENELRNSDHQLVIGRRIIVADWRLSQRDGFQDFALPTSFEHERVQGRSNRH
jgi:hypothetical protein